MKFALRMTLPLLIAACATGAFAQTGPTEKGTVSYPASALKWTELAESDDVQYANVRGDLAGSGRYESFVRFPAGKNNPFHHHSSAIPTVVLAGTFYAVVDGVRTDYPAGSFYHLPASRAHFSGCADGADCLLFQYQDGPFDLVAR